MMKSIFNFNCCCISDAGLEFVTRDQYTVHSETKIGGGFFGAVYRGDYLGPVAVKIIETTHSVATFKAEINIAG